MESVMITLAILVALYTSAWIEMLLHLRIQ